VANTRNEYRTIFATQSYPCKISDFHPPKVEAPIFWPETFSLHKPDLL